ncbi:MAG: SDR family oxidoreductase [Chitinophagales bacterium]|nr:SDR family oxidoreductase [Chitinophagaceae bacterium]MCB9064930.1 SDR family oxidoreductase [Chitinophagales bacterium]
MPNAVITGGTQGIGKAIAERFLSEGYSVAICARTQKDLNAVQDEWERYYADENIITYKADLSKKEEVKAFAQHVLHRFKTIDVLVNNAGLFYPGLLATEPEGQLEKLMEINMYSAYHLTRALLPKMKEQGSGHIFNMSSVAGLKAYPNGGAYGITKYAMMGFSENLRYELKDEGIKVSSICPGATNSRSWEGAGIDPDRIMDAKDVADIVWASYNLSSKADVETIVIRPQKGDL